MLLALIKVSLLVMATSLPVSQSKAKEFEVENLKHQPGPEFKFPNRSFGNINNFNVGVVMGVAYTAGPIRICILKPCLLTFSAFNTF